MKAYFWILSTFRPEQTVTVLLDSINKFWPGNAVKIKKNFWMLIPAFWKIVLGIFMFIGLIVLAFYQYYDKGFIKTFTIIVSFYVFLTFFWLLFSFLRILKNKKEEKIYYTAVTTDMVLNLNNFKSYVNTTLFVMFLQGILAIINIALVIKISWNLVEYLITTWQFLINAYFIVLMYQVLKKIIDSEMDFVIATPTTMTFFSQTGFFQTNTNVVNNTQIKSFNETTVWFSPSILGYWTILIRTEGDDLSEKDIDNNDTNRLKLRFVSSPKKVIDKLESVIRSNIKEDRINNKQFALEDFLELDYSFEKTIFSLLMPWFLLNKIPKQKNSTDDFIKKDELAVKLKNIQQEKEKEKGNLTLKEEIQLLSQELKNTQNNLDTISKKLETIKKELNKNPS